MQAGLSSKNVEPQRRFLSPFRTRDIFVHDGAAMRRITATTQLQIGVCALLLVLLGWSLFAAVQLRLALPATAEVAAMEARVAAMSRAHEALKRDAAAHAARLDARQEFLAAIVRGEDPARLAARLPAEGAADRHPIAAFAKVEQGQAELAALALAETRTRYVAARGALRKLGLDPARFQRGPQRLAMGGPFEPVPAVGKADPEFQQLFLQWKKLDQLEQGVISVPSQRPVMDVSFTSGFGVRADPFRGSAAMHAGIDLAGPIGTPIYATADGIVGRAGWVGGYGNLVEINHGRGIQTRYGHLSKILVPDNSRVKRGQLIALMGSTGRSTGSHLHYEVRIDGRAVNPVPYIQSADYVASIQKRAAANQVALGGPDE